MDIMQQVWINFIGSFGLQIAMCFIGLALGLRMVPTPRKDLEEEKAKGGKKS